MKTSVWGLIVCLPLCPVCCSPSVKAPSEAVPSLESEERVGSSSGGEDPRVEKGDGVVNEEKEVLRKETEMTGFTMEDGFQVDGFKTPSGKDIRFYCIKHGSLRIRYGDTEFQIDPVGDYDGVVTDYSALPKADYILVTHEHYDHYDKVAVDTLTKDSSVIVTNANVYKMMGRGEVMANGDEKQLREDIHLRAVPAYNTTAGRDKFHPKGRDNGFVLTLDGFRIYIAGDTEDIPEMSDIRDIDVAFLPCNQPYTMTPEQLDRAVRLIHPKVVFPYHYGQTDMGRLTELLKDSGVDVRIRNYQ